MRKKHSTRKDILFLSISSFVVIVAWVGFNLYHSYVTTTITPELQIQIQPISPDFDNVTIDKLKSRKQVAPVTSLSNAKPEPTFTPVLPNPTQTVPTQTEIPVTINGE